MVALDYKSLYPSIIMTFNLSPEKIIYDKNMQIPENFEIKPQTINYI